MALACALWWEVLAYRKRIGHLFRFVHRDVRSLRNGCTTPAAERKRNIFDYFAIYAGKDVTDRALGVLATVIPEEYRRNSRRAGLIVLAVRKGSQADCAGIMRGGILVSFGRKPITRNALETCVIQWESLSPSHWIETETCWRSTLRRSDFQKKI